jgi:hypothetical protein
MIRITFELEEFEVAPVGTLKYGTCYTLDTDNPVAFMKIDGGNAVACVGVNLHTGTRHSHHINCEVFPLVADLTLRRSRGGKA